MIETPQDGSIAEKMLALAKQDLEAASTAKYVQHAGRHYADALEKAARACISKGTKNVPSKHNLAKLVALLPNDLQGYVGDDALVHLRAYLSKVQYGAEPPHATLVDLHAEVGKSVTAFVAAAERHLEK